MVVNYREWYASNLDQVEEIISFVCRRNGIQDSLAEDFRSELHLKLMADDFAVLRKFQHKSSFKTYLSMVVQHAFQDFRNKVWGKWRPSTAAKNLGETAIRLEMLTHRDGLSFTEAVQVLRTNEGIGDSEAALQTLYQRLPHRDRRTHVDGEILENLSEPDSSPDAALQRNEAKHRRRRMASALTKALGRLDPEDHYILTMHYREGIKVSVLAQTLQMEQRPLYRRMKKILGGLHEEMRREGIMKEDVKDVLTWLD